MTAKKKNLKFKRMIDYFVDSWNNYYLTDIIATILVIWSLLELSHKKRAGFMINAIASAVWIIWHGVWGSYAGAFMNVVLVIINIYGWINWTKTK